MDFSLRDAFTDGASKATQDSLLKRDFVAGLEAQTFDDKVGETVGKTDYRPLLDGMDGKREGMSLRTRQSSIKVIYITCDIYNVNVKK